jgi:hypothetical protein
MQDVHIDDRVRLTREIPELSLHRGDSGVVRSVWCSPNDFYDIEFARHEPHLPSRCLVSAIYVEIQDKQVVKTVSGNQ